MQFFLLALFAALIAGIDQLTKLLVVQNIPLYAKVDAIPGLFNLTYVQNTGAAWSILEGARWAFVVLFVVLTAALLLEYFKKPLPLRKYERWFLAAIYGGGLGNIIDRVFRGFVVDMINLEFMEFPVFNVADCFITCGCIALFVSLVFFNKEFWKDEKKTAEE